jgi:hypothetical protein
MISLDRFNKRIGVAGVEDVGDAIGVEARVADFEAYARITVDAPGLARSTRPISKKRTPGGRERSCWKATASTPLSSASSCRLQQSPFL